MFHITDNKQYLETAVDYIKHFLRHLKGRKLSFLCGDAGPLALGAVIYHKLGNNAASKDCARRCCLPVSILILFPPFMNPVIVCSLHHSQQFLVIPGCFPVFLGLTSTKQMIKCLAQGHNTVPPVSLKLRDPLTQGFR